MKKRGICNINQKGFTLWFVMFSTLVIITILLTMLRPFIQHREVLQMRLGQIESTQMVKNGVAYLRSKVDATMKSSTILHKEFSSGGYTIKIESNDKQKITALISGYSQSGYKQSYRVKITIDNRLVTFFYKMGSS